MRSDGLELLEGHAVPVLEALLHPLLGLAVSDLASARIPEAAGTETNAGIAGQLLNAAVVNEVLVGIVEIRRYRSAAHVSRGRAKYPDQRCAVRVSQF